MIRIIGAILVFSAFSGIGIYLDKSIKERYKSLVYIKDALGYLSINISSFDMPIKAALINADKSAQGRVRVLKEAADNIRDCGIKTAWRMAVENNKNELCLKNGDVNFILALSNTLGTVDIDTQIKCIGGTVKGLDMIIEEAKRDCDVKGGLYKKCSILFGLMMVIILI